MAKEIITIELNDASLQAKLNNINKSLNENNKALAKNNAEIKSLAATTKDLDKAFKTGSISADEYTEELERNATATARLKEENRGLSTESRKLTTDQRNLTNIQEQQVGSLNRLRAELNIAIKQFDGLSREQRENEGVGKMLQSRIETLTVEVGKAEQATGRFQRQVGNYSGAGEIFKETLKAQGGALGTLINVASSSKAAFTAAGTGVKGFSAALATTGIPIVIAAVMGLIDVFKQFTPIADAVEDIVNALGAGFRALISGGNIAEAVKQSNALLETLRDLEDTQAGFNIQQAKGRSEIERLIISSKDRTKTEEERLQNLQRAESLERELFQSELQRNDVLLKQQEKSLMQTLKLSKEELQILATTADASDKNFQRIKANAENNAAFNKELLNNFRSTLTERVQLEGDTNKQLEKITNANNKLIEKQEAEAEKAEQQRIARAAQEKQRLERLLAEQQKYNQDLTNLQNEFTLNERQRLENSFNEKLNQIVGFSVKEIELRFKILDAQDKALQEFDDKKRQEAFEKLLQNTKTETDLEFEIRKQGLLLQQASKEQFEQLNFERQIAQLESERQLRSINLEETVAIDNQILELKQQNAERIKALNKQVADKAIADAQRERQEKINAFQNIFGALVTFAKRGSALSKASAIAGIVASQAEAIAGAIASAVKVSFPANFPALASLLGSVAAVIGQSKQVLASAPDIQGFATGGRVNSGIPIKRSNGDNVLATLKTGEVVLNQNQQSKLGGASTFRAIGVPGFATGGTLSAPITNAVDSGNSLAQQFSSAIENIQIFTAITDINTGQNNFSQVVERSQV